MRTLATKQPAKDADKQRHREHRLLAAGGMRLHNVSPVATGMPLIQRKCACGGGCPRCQELATLQPKLKLSEPGDPYEQEADRIADQVMQMPEPSVKGQIESEKTLLAKRMQGQTPEIPPSLGSHIQQRRSLGQSMDKMTRTKMESFFGADFNSVNIHTDNHAAQINRALNAQAITIGNDIFFNSGKYLPGSAAGDHLLAHELTHVLQQRVGHQSFIQRKDAQEQGCDGKVSDSFELLATMPASPRQYSTALIGQLHQPDLLPKTYFIGDWLNDYMQIVDIPYINRAAVVVMHCETEETLEAEPGTSPNQTPNLPQAEHRIEVSESNFGSGIVEIFDGCQRVVFEPQDSSGKRREYKLETWKQPRLPEMQVYVPQEGERIPYSPVDLSSMLKVHLLGEKCGTPVTTEPQGAEED